MKTEVRSAYTPASDSLDGMKNFLLMMGDFRIRHPEFIDLQQDHNLPSEFGVQFIGTLRDELVLPCMIGWYEQYPNSRLRNIIKIGVLLQSEMASIDTRSIEQLEYRIHRDIPNTREFSLFTHVDEKGYLISIGSMFTLKDAPLVSDVEEQFVKLCYSAKRVARQFFQPQHPEVPLFGRLL